MSTNKKKKKKARWDIFTNTSYALIDVPESITHISPSSQASRNIVSHINQVHNKNNKSYYNLIAQFYVISVEIENFRNLRRRAIQVHNTHHL